MTNPTTTRPATPKTAPPRGIVAAVVGPAPVEFAHARYVVDGALAASIEHWWTVRWRMNPAETQARSTLSHPSIHVSFGDGDDGRRARVVGVPSGRFTWILRGSGSVFAAKFHPGAFRPVLGRAVSSLSDRSVSLDDVFGASFADAVTAAIDACASDDERVATAAEFFAGVTAPPPPEHALLRELVRLACDREVKSVDELAARGGLSVRSLQRWFRDDVGVSPKWMIQRYRLHDALAALDDESDDALAHVAADLGYADQAHFARDFKAVVGMSPSHYRRQR